MDLEAQFNSGRGRQISVSISLTAWVDEHSTPAGSRVFSPLLRDPRGAVSQRLELHKVDFRGIDVPFFRAMKSCSLTPVAAEMVICSALRERSTFTEQPGRLPGFFWQICAPTSRHLSGENAARTAALPR
jgi:hypothetical protein